MHEFWYDYIKPRYEEKAQLCYMDTDSFIVCKKDAYGDIAKDATTKLDTLNYKVGSPLPRGKKSD